MPTTKTLLHRPTLPAAVSSTCIGLLVAAGPVSAAPPETMPKTVIEGSNVAGAATSPSLEEAAYQRREIPGAITLRDTSDMYRGLASGFQDLLARTPGLVMQSENGSEVGEMSIRGSGVLSDEEPIGIMFLLDGFPMNQGDGQAILEDFNLGAVKYAEVFRGANAFKYGSITLGGAVNLVSRTGYDAAPAELRLEGGSFGFFRGQVASGGAEGSVDYFAAVTGRRTDGYRLHQAENSEDFTGNLGWKLSDRLENRVFISFSRTDRQRPGGLTKDQLEEDPRQADPVAVQQDLNKAWTYSRIADKITFKTDTEQIDAGVFWWHRNLVSRDYYTADSPDGIQGYYSDNVGVVLNSVTRGQVFGQANTLTAGLSPNVEREVDANYQNIGGLRGARTAADTEFSVNAPFYLEDQLHLTEKLSVIGGLQAIYAQRNFHDLFVNTVTGDTSGDLVVRGLNPKLGLLYEVDRGTQFFANYSRSWEPPSFDNMVEFDDAPGGSLVFTPLLPQHAWTAEFGGRGELGSFRWELALFHSWVRNELLDVNNAQGVNLGAVNIDRTYHQGIEAGAETELLGAVFTRRGAGRKEDSLVWEQSYTLNDLHFDHDPVYGNNRIAIIPIHLYQAALTYRHPSGFYAGPTLRWNITKYPVDHANTLYADAYAVLGLRAGYQSSNGFSVFVEGKNLTGERYAGDVDPIPDARTAGGLPTIFHPGDGRGVFAGVAWRL
jgi:iron complex outermembrane recepter protein